MSSMAVANRQAAGPCPRTSWWGRHIDLVVLLAAPWILFLAGTTWFCNNETSDSWLYHGSFFQLPRYLKEFLANTYQSTRLPWMLPGYLAYQLLPPPFAHLALHLLLYYAATFAFYYVVRQTINRNTALVGSLLFCTHFDFLDVVGTDYVVGPSITYLLLSLAFITLSKYSAWKRTWDVCAGGALVAAVFVYPALLAIVPLVGLYVLFKQPQQRRSSSWREFLAQSSFLTLGGALTTVGFGLISAGLGGTFTYFMPSVHFILGNLDVGKLYYEPWGDDIFAAHWLVLPVAAWTSALGLLGLAVVRKGGLRRMEALYAGMALFVCVFCVAWDYYEMDVYLRMACYMALMMPFVFLALCAFAMKVPEGAHPVCMIILVLLVLGSALPPIAEAVDWVNPVAPGYARLGVVLAFVAGGLVVKGLGGRTLLGTVLSCAALLAAYLGAFDAFCVQSASANLGTRGQARSERVHSMLRFIQKHIPDERPFFWYSRDERLVSEYIAVSGMFNWGRSVINDELPGVEKLDEASPVEFVDDQCVIVLAADRAKFTAAEEAVRPLGCRFTFVDETEVAAGAIHYLARLYRARLTMPGEPIGLCTDGTAGAAVLGGNSTPGPLTAELWKPEETCRFDRLADTIAVESTREPSGYVASYGPIEIADAGEYVFVVKYRLRAGSLTLGCLNEGRRSWLCLAATDDRPTGNGSQRVRLSLSAGQKITLMLTANKPTTRFSITGAHANKLKPPA